MNLKFYKAFSLILIVIFFVFIITVFSFGLKLNFADGKKEISYKESGSFSIFVGGAVENEKFYEVRFSTTYGELFLEAGALKDSSLKILYYHETVNPFDSNIIYRAVNRKEWFIICNYENFTNKNINSARIDELVECGMLEYRVIEIKNYITKYGEIKDKNDLVDKGLLTKEEFEAVKYKIYAY